MVKSMYAAVAGLRTHQAKMDVIGNNIANVNTFGFKKARASFRDQFYATMRGSSNPDALYGGGNPNQVGYGASLSSIEVDFGTASQAPTGNGMDVSIGGNGFFMVGTFSSTGYGVVSNDGGNNLTSLSLTRVGIFYLDGEGWLVDPLRNHAYGYAYELASALDSEGEPLSKLEWQVGGLSDMSDIENLKPRLEAIQAPWALYDSSTGKAVLYDTDNAAAAAAEYYNDLYDTEFTAQDFLGKAVVVPWAMDGQSYLTDDRTGKKIPLIDSTAIDDTLYSDAADASDAFLTMLEDAFGFDTTATPPEYYAAAMKMTNISIGTDGLVTGTNGDSQENVILGQLILADVPNPNALESMGDGYYRAKNNTGVVTASQPGHGSTGLLKPGSLEMANVDLAQEFTDMITTQRGFQANGRIITVTDEMLAELVNLKR